MLDIVKFIHKDRLSIFVLIRNRLGNFYSFEWFFSRFKRKSIINNEMRQNNKNLQKNNLRKFPNILVYSNILIYTVSNLHEALIHKHIYLYLFLVHFIHFSCEFHEFFF